MNSLYDLRSWREHLHEELLQGVQNGHLVGRVMKRSARVPLMLATLALVAILLGVAGCADAGGSDAGAYAGGSDAEGSTSDPTPETEYTDTWEDTGDADTEQYQYDPAPNDGTIPPDATETAGLEGEYLGLRYTSGLSSSTSMECYTFYSDGTVELRHNGASTATDSGSYEGDASGGKILWDSGRASYVVGEGGSMRINDLEVEPIDSCLVPTSS